MSSVMSNAASAAFGLLDRAWTAACWPLIALLNMFFRPDPQTGAVSFWKVALWLAANAVILYLAVTDLKTNPLFWTLVVFLIVHILIIMSSLRIMYEEKKVMEGAMKPEEMRFSAFDTVNNLPILASSVVFYILGVAALIQTVEQTGLAQILRSRPTLINDYTEYLACVLNEVPLVSTAINAWANLYKFSDNVTAQIVYNGWAGNGVRVLIVVTISVDRAARAGAASPAVEPPGRHGARHPGGDRDAGEREEAAGARADDLAQPPDGGCAREP